jgi:hypothetical protein
MHKPIVYWLTLPRFILEVQGQNTDPATRYPEEGL